MIRVIVNTRNDEVISLEVSGHAEFAEYGKDIVCASCSLISTGLLNALDEMVHSKCRLIRENNRIYIEVLENVQEVQTIMNTGIIQLETLSEAFPKYVKIKRTEVKL